ncbi:hypothetical protein DNTS_009552, partial [Danionella cerebrum]
EQKEESFSFDFDEFVTVDEVGEDVDDLKVSEEKSEDDNSKYSLTGETHEAEAIENMHKMEDTPEEATPVGGASQMVEDIDEMETAIISKEEPAPPNMNLGQDFSETFEKSRESFPEQPKTQEPQRDEDEEERVEIPELLPHGVLLTLDEVSDGEGDKDFIEETNNEELSRPDEFPETLLTVDEVGEDETAEEYKIEKELLGLVTLDEIVDEEEFNPEKPDESEPAGTKRLPEEPGKTPTMEELSKMNLLTVDEVGEEEEECPPIEKEKPEDPEMSVETEPVPEDSTESGAAPDASMKSAQEPEASVESASEPKASTGSGLETSIEGEPGPETSVLGLPATAASVDLKVEPVQDVISMKALQSPSQDVPLATREDKTSDQTLESSLEAKSDSTIKEESKPRQDDNQKQEPEPKRSRSNSPMIEDMPPFNPDNPIGVEFVVPKTGYFCRLCCLFYGCEDKAKKNHCSSLKHYENMQKYYKKLKSMHQQQQTDS